MNTNYLLEFWKLTAKDPLHGVSGWLRKFLKATHYHPERTYMRARQDGGRGERKVSRGGGTSA